MPVKSHNKDNKSDDELVRGALFLRLTSSCSSRMQSFPSNSTQASAPTKAPTISLSRTQEHREEEILDVRSRSTVDITKLDMEKRFQLEMNSHVIFPFFSPAKLIFR